MSDGMNDWADTLDGIRTTAWECLAPGRPRNRLEAHLATLATVGLPPRGAEARLIVIRAADPVHGTVDLHTDSETEKLREIDADPRVTLMYWHPAELTQIRLRAEAQVITGPAAAEAWARVPIAAQPNYGVTPAPGAPIDGPGDYHRLPHPARFAILRLTVTEMDVVVLTEPVHRRALFSRADDWAGQWLAP